MSKTKVFAVRPDRLGGRLSAIVNAKRLSDMFDLDLQVFWSKPKNAYPELVTPEAIFSDTFIANHFMSEDTAQGSLKFTAIPKRSAPMARADFTARIAAGEDFGFTTREGAVALPFEDQQAARVGFAKTFQNLDFSDAFRTTKDHIDDVLNDDLEYVAVHIRRGDVIRNPNTSEGFWHGQFVPDAIYFEALDTLIGSNVRFVLFCDDAAVLQTYQTRYETAVSAAKITGADGQPALHIDLAEMYLMSRCARILCPRSSAFSMVAADLSAIDREPVEDLLSPAQMRRAIGKLAQDIKIGVGAFHSEGDFKQSLNALMKYSAFTDPQMNVIDVATLAQNHGIATVHLLDASLKHTLDTGDLGPVSWLQPMVQTYEFHHVSALGEPFAALAYARVLAGERYEGLQCLGWANWFYPESQFVSYVSSILMGDGGAWFDGMGYDSLGLKSAIPPHKGLRFLGKGAFADAVDSPFHLKNHMAPVALMDWLEFVNPKTRRRLQMRSIMARDIVNSLPDDIAALNTVMQSGGSLASLQAIAKDGDALAAKRLATGCFRVGECDAGLKALHMAVERSGDQPAYVAAYGVRLLEFGHTAKAVEVFDGLAEMGLTWTQQSPAVTYAHAQALSGEKAFVRSAQLIARNLDFSNSCLVSNTLRRQLQQYL